jgi:hypothetical protein
MSELLSDFVEEKSGKRPINAGTVICLIRVASNVAISASDISTDILSLSSSSDSKTVLSAWTLTALYVQK